MSEFESDKEPPKDKIMKKKLVFKENLYRVYKTILHSGTNLFKPAKFDKVIIKIA